MHLIDDQIFLLQFQRFVTFPVVIFHNDLTAVLEGIFRIRFNTPDITAGYCLGIGIQQDLFLIKPKALLRIVRTVKAVAVFHSLRIQTKHHHGINIPDTEAFREGDLHEGLFHTAVIEQQCTAGGLLRKNAEVDTTVRQRCAKREHAAHTVLQMFDRICRKRINGTHRLTG